MGGGLESRVTGYDTFKLGFGIIGARVEQFFDTNYNSMRNFHGEWYSDAYKLNDLFDLEQEVTIYTVKFEDIGEKLMLSTAQMEAMLFMIED